MGHPLCLVFLLLLSLTCNAVANANETLAETYRPGNVAEDDVDLLEFQLNLEFLEAEFFLHGALGYGLDRIAPDLAEQGPPPTGAKKAKLVSLVAEIIEEFGNEEVGHLRAIKDTIIGFPRPPMDLSASTFAEIFDAAFNEKLDPPFNPYGGSVHFLLASYLFPYVVLTGYVGMSPFLQSGNATRLVAGLIAVQSGQDAIIRTLLYEKKDQVVQPYNYTVAEFTDKLSGLRDSLGHSRNVDEGLSVRSSSARSKWAGRPLSADANSVGFGRTAKQILGIVYNTGNCSRPNGFFPQGANGVIARTYQTNNQELIGRLPVNG